MFQSKLSISFWGDSILVATYIINRLPSVNLAWKSPYEMLFLKPPNIDHLRVFRCLCFFSNNSPHKIKFDPRAFPGVFVGYSTGQKRYMVYDFDTRRLLLLEMLHFMKSLFFFILRSHLIDIADHVTSDEHVCLSYVPIDHDPVVSDVLHPLSLM
ncbi:hypothetical protein LIER_30925 [Lithospermum erythrorhizon]|uniref:Retroviral polymerase SH3-like domain-containing protein n=1 Tax=Lithospermum erythrorhizon TaxID=34254 RepID=A0AAV3RPA1_LITER